MHKASLSVLSNAPDISEKEKYLTLLAKLKEVDIEASLVEHFFAKNFYASASAQIRAKEVNELFKDETIEYIFDVSGGSIANETLPYLDYEAIKNSGAIFFGYSDLTTIINAIYAKTNKKSVLYQIRNLIKEDSLNQTSNFNNYLQNINNDLFTFDYEFIQGSKMMGTVIGGNMRCFLKLAATSYLPDFKDKILLLEGLSGDATLILTYINQLVQMDVFNKVNGVILGSFTQMQEEEKRISIEDLFLTYLPQDLPIIKTNEIGHYPNSKAIIIGENYKFEK